MDWTLFFDDEGSSVRDDAARVPLRASLAANGQHDDTYGPSGMFALTCNYLVGVGVLSLPFAFARAGLILAAFCTVVAAALAALTCCFVLNAGARASTSSLRNAEHAPLLDANADVEIRTPDSGTRALGELEVVDLCALFLPKRAQNAYQISLLVLMLSGLVAYTNVFTTSVVSIWKLPGCHSAPHAFDWACASTFVVLTLLFAAVVLPLSLLSLKRQLGLQLTVAWVSLAALLCMSAVCFWLVYGATASPFGHGYPLYGDGIRAAEFSETGMILSTALFSFLCQHSVPGLAKPLKDKHKAGRVLVLAIAFVCALYTLIGIATAVAFGKPSFLKEIFTREFLPYYLFCQLDDVFPLRETELAPTLRVLFPVQERTPSQPAPALPCAQLFAEQLTQSACLRVTLIQQYTLPAVNLDFAKLATSTVLDAHSPLLRWLSYALLLLPAVQSISVFPLIALTLSNSMISFLRLRYGVSASRQLRLICTGGVVSTACGISIFLRDLSAVLQVAGIVGAIVALVIPAKLEIASRRYAEARGTDVVYLFLPPTLRSPGFVKFVLVASYATVLGLTVSALTSFAGLRRS